MLGAWRRGAYYQGCRGYGYTWIYPWIYTSRVIDVWNCLNDDIVKSPSISVFKKRMSGVKFDRFLTVTD